MWYVMFALAGLACLKFGIRAFLAGLAFVAVCGISGIVLYLVG
jgi:hypothetical protein